MSHDSKGTQPAAQESTGPGESISGRRIQGSCTRTPPCGRQTNGTVPSLLQGDRVGPTDTVPDLRLDRTQCQPGAGEWIYAKS